MFQVYYNQQELESRDVATLGSAGWLRPALEPTTWHSERFKVFGPTFIMVD